MLQRRCKTYAHFVDNFCERQCHGLWSLHDDAWGQQISKQQMENQCAENETLKVKLRIGRPIAIMILGYRHRAVEHGSLA